MASEIDFVEWVKTIVGTAVQIAGDLRRVVEAFENVHRVPSEVAALRAELARVRPVVEAAKALAEYQNKPPAKLDVLGIDAWLNSRDTLIDDVEEAVAALAAAVPPDTTRPNEAGRLSFEESMQLIRERYDGAIRQLGESEVIDRAASAALEAFHQPRHPEHTFELTTEGYRDAWRSVARAVLAAAVPTPAPAEQPSDPYAGGFCCEAGERARPGACPWHPASSATPAPDGGEQ